jgi:transcriptional regulator with XRE-family HTH domain
MKLAEYLSGLRAANGWSLREAAAQCALSNGYLSLLENGKIDNPSASILAKLAKGYSVPLDAVLGAAGLTDARARQPLLEPRLLAAVGRLSEADLGELTRYATYLAERPRRRRR